MHNGGILEKKAYSKLTVMQDIVISDSLIKLNHEQMYKLFRYLKQGVAERLLEYTGNLPGAPKASEISGIAIQNCI